MSLLQTTANRGAARLLLGQLPQGDLDCWSRQFVNAARLDDVFR